MALGTNDMIILAIVLVLGTVYLYRQLQPSVPTHLANGGSLNGTAAGANGKSGTATGAANGFADTGRDFVAAMKQNNKKIVIFYGSQTGTAEDYSTRIAKEAKSRFGLSSLVVDPEDYDFDNLDQVPDDCLVVFCLATYGEGEPTDNAVALHDFLKEDEPEFSEGNSVENLKYVVFSLGNSTYEHFCAFGRFVDQRLTKFGAKRVGPAGEGDDDKSMEEDYLAWKDGMWEAVQKEMGWTEGAGGDVADFEVREVDESSVDRNRVYLGELSARALAGTRGVFDAKNPYAAPVKSTKELFQDGDRNCVFAEFDIADSGIRYQTGDHIGIWPVNPDAEVERFLRVLGLQDKRDQVIEVVSLDPALAKVPFPVPTTYDTVLRNYLDISAVASRQAIGTFAKYAPNEQAKQMLERLGSDKAYYHEQVGSRCLKLAEVLQVAAGDSLTVDPVTGPLTVWSIAFDRIISAVHRLQPRYYSISSSPKLHPNSIHVTAVVLKYKPHEQSHSHVYGVGTNYLLNLKAVTSGEAKTAREEGTPVYRLEGPRGKYKKNGVYAAPVHVRRSNFRLPTSPKIPIIMIGPGTGVAPFRGFLQERLALARKAKEKDGPDALKDWATMDLFYGCRRSDWDFLYKEEWQEYEKELDGKFRLHVALSREPGKPKTYVQKLIEQEGDHIGNALVQQKGYAYICGDANMARDVEKLLEDVLGKAKGGSKEDGVKELKMLKDRNRLLLDVWS